jgi:2',3'-cyclic-nucleotide 2'-phosphodiesterase (5'-nucleotidase family)
MWFLMFLLLAPGWAAPVRILTTGDMHGALKGSLMDGYQIGGAASMLAAWKAREEYAPGKYLVLSAGDNIGYSPLSNALEGEPDIEVMNAMGFNASAISMTEFAFGRGQFLRLGGQATFPFLAANLINTAGTPVEVAKPYVILDVQGTKVAVIGLMTQNIPPTVNLGLLKVTPHEPALRFAAQEARLKGAQAIIVIGSLTFGELNTLAHAVPDLKIPLMIAGFSHEVCQTYLGDCNTWVISNGSRWASYGRIDLDVDADGARVTSIKQVQLEQRNATLDPAVQAIVDRNMQKLGPDYNKPIGASATGLYRSSSGLAFALTAWLAADPNAEFAATNTGGMRQDLPAGPFTKADVINMLPFDDKLYRINITGQQLIDLTAPNGDGIALVGLGVADGKFTCLRTGEPLDLRKTYRLLLVDYLYSKCDGMKKADAAPVTALPDWRHPLYKWLADHDTVKGRPVEKSLTLPKVVKYNEQGMIAEPPPAVP